MQIHHRIIHHVHRHKERVVAHVKRHHKKYIVGAGILSWVALYKIIWVLIIFLGASQINAPIGADYYDAEYYATQTGEVINISNMIDTKEIDTSETNTSETNIWTGTNNTTWCIDTWTNGTWCTIGEIKTTP